MKKNLYFAGLMASSCLFSADNTVQFPGPRDLDRQPEYHRNYRDTMRFFASLAQQLSAHQILPASALVPTESDGHKIFRRGQRAAMRRAFNEQSDELKGTIVRTLTERHAPFLQELLLTRSAEPIFSPQLVESAAPRHRRRDAETIRAYERKYRHQMCFFGALAHELITYRILSRDRIVPKYSGRHKIFGEELRQRMLQAFAEHSNNETKDTIVTRLEERYPALAEQLLMQVNQTQSHVSNSRPPATLEGLYALLEEPGASL